MEKDLAGSQFKPVLVGLIAIPLAFQSTGADPLNPIKLIFLVFLGFWALSTLAGEFLVLKSVPNFLDRNYAALLLAFLVSLVVVFALTDEKTTGLVGYSGRNLGLINYLMLAVISLYVMVKINITNLKQVLQTARILLLILAIYGIAQHFNADFLSWKNSYSPVILITGNPDFAASLLGVLIVLTFGFIAHEEKKRSKLISGFILLISLPPLFWTRATQGIIVVLVGISIQALLFIWQRRRRIALVLIATESLIALLGVFGALQKGPLTKLIYKDSIRDRGYDWHAAISMFKSHPLSGVGLDRYGAYFGEFKSLKYSQIYGNVQTVNNAHNVFLHFFATGGLLLGITYLILILYVSKSAYTLLKTSKGSNQIVYGTIISAWISLLAQSFISVDILSISIWAWVLMGAIVGLNLQKQDKSTQIKSTQVVQAPIQTLILIGGLICSLLIAIPIYGNESAVKKFTGSQALQNSSDAAVYKSYANGVFNRLWLSSNSKNQVALTLIKNNFVEDGIKLLGEATISNTRNLEAYSVLANIFEYRQYIDLHKAIRNREQIYKYDPFNTDNLLKLENDYVLTKRRDMAIKIQAKIKEIAPNSEIEKQSLAILNL